MEEPTSPKELDTLLRVHYIKAFYKFVEEQANISEEREPIKPEEWEIHQHPNGKYYLCNFWRENNNAHIFSIPLSHIKIVIMNNLERYGWKM